MFPKPMSARVEAFEIEETTMGPTQVVVRTHVTLISPGTELATFRGLLGMQDDAPRSFPVQRVGYANVGTVVARGSDVCAEVGDRVFTMGFHASRVRLDARDLFCVRVPEGLVDEEAVFVRMAQVSMTTLRTTLARPGDDVAVVGLGLVGNLAAQVFQANGMNVIGFDPSASRRELAMRSGIRSVHSIDEIEVFRRRHRLSIECSGAAEGVAAAVELTASHGEIVMVGAPWGGEANSIPSSRLTRDIFFRFLKLRSGSEWEIPRRPDPYVRHSIVKNVESGLRWLADGRLTVAPLITHRFDPADIQRAYEGLLRQKDAFLGVILKWQG